MSEAKQGVLLLEKVQPSKTNPRRHVDPARQQELTASVVKHGVMTPILVRPVNAHFEIVAGERRFRAAKAAGLKEIPAVIRELSDADALELQMVENLQRDDLHPLEEAEGYRQLLQVKFGPGRQAYDAAKIAERVGRSVKYVYDRIKLLQLIEPIHKVFLEGRITAGHAILLARLSPQDQKLVADRNHGGLYAHEDAHFKEIVGESDGYKVRSVRELQQFIDEHCRFVPERDADPMLFPETAAILKTADAKKKSDKIVPITYGYVQDSARHGEKHIAPTSWERADGKKGSRTCEFSVIGVVVAGENRAQAFRVCTNKEKCKTHWAAWQKARANRLGTTGLKTEGMSDAERQRKERAAREAQEAKQKAEKERWERAVPAIAQALAAAVKKAPAKATGLLADLILDSMGDSYLEKGADKYLARGTSAEDLIRYIAFNVVYGQIDNQWDRENFLKTAKALGVDAQKILDQVAPVQTSAAKAKK